MQRDLESPAKFSETILIHLDSEDDYRTGCRNVSHCQQQQSYSGLRSPGRSNSTYFWNDSWVQTFHTSLFVFVTNIWSLVSIMRLTTCSVNSWGDIIPDLGLDGFRKRVTELSKFRRGIKNCFFSIGGSLYESPFSLAMLRAILQAMLHYIGYCYRFMWIRVIMRRIILLIWWCCEMWY